MERERQEERELTNEGMKKNFEREFVKEEEMNCVRERMKKIYTQTPEGERAEGGKKKDSEQKTKRRRREREKMDI